jgi:decaprenyl-phosphate phosphoribosyltransferase
MGIVDSPSTAAAGVRSGFPGRTAMLPLQELRRRAGGVVEGQVGTLLTLLRPAEWPTSLLVALPLLLSPQLVTTTAVAEVALAVVVFAVLGGVCHGVDTLLDRRAAGAAVERRTLAALAGVLVLAMLLAFTLGTGFALMAVLLVAVQACHAVGRGRLVVIDVLLLATALVVRIDAGAVVIGVAAGPYFLVLIGVLAMFATLCRARRELAMPLGRARPDLGRRYLDVLISALLCALVVGYVMIVGHDPGIRAAAGAWIHLSAAFVLTGLLRFWHLTVVEERHEGLVELLRRDRWLAASLLLWLVTVVATLHL